MNRLVCLVPLAGVIAGCADGPKPGGLPPQPRGLIAETVVMMRSEPTDGDGDGLADRVGASIYLFPDEGRYSQPLWLDGTFTFTLTDMERNPITSWEFSSGDAVSAQRSSGDLRHYGFRLEISPELAGGPLRATRLQCEFTPADGAKPVRSKFITLQVGRSP